MRRFALILLTASAAACGGSPAGPDSGTPTPTPTAAPTTAPVPTPTPIPCTQGLCETPVTNTNSPARIHVKVFLVFKPDGEIAPCSGEDPAAPGGPAPFTVYGFAPIPVGYRVVLDATPFDRFDKPTNGKCTADPVSCINWRQEDGSDRIVDYSQGHIFQPKFRVAAAGDFQIQAEMRDDQNGRIRSPWFWMKFVDDPSQSPCGR